jgi:hypothetical protein
MDEKNAFLMDAPPKSVKGDTSILSRARMGSAASIEIVSQRRRASS